MSRHRIAGVVAGAVSIVGPIVAQERLELDLLPDQSLFEWSGTSNISGLVDPDFDPTYGWLGGLELEVTQGPNGPRGRIDGADIAFEPDIVGTTITALFGRVEFADVRITIASTPFDLASIAPLQTDLTLTFTAGTLNVEPPFGPAQSTPLAGRVIGTVPVTGSMGITASGDFELHVSLFAFELRFDSPAFHGTILSTGFFHADTTCPFASYYCSSAPNSMGTEARMNVVGLPSVSQNDLSLQALFLPSQAPGLFYYGPTQTQVPVGDGFLCVGGTAFRLPVVMSNNTGQAFFSIDLSLPPSPAGQILPGSTWNFQFWYRDPGGPGGSGFNFTDAATLRFCP